MLIILAPITGGVRCGYSSTGPIKKKKKKKEKKRERMGEVGEGEVEGGEYYGGGGGYFK